MEHDWKTNNKTEVRWQKFELLEKRRKAITGKLSSEGNNSTSNPHRERKQCKTMNIYRDPTRE